MSDLLRHWGDFVTWDPTSDPGFLSRLVIVMTTDMCFDIAIEDAQRAGGQFFGERKARRWQDIRWDILGFCRFTPILYEFVKRVGGLDAIFYFPIYWVSNHPNWRSYFSEGWPNHQPDEFVQLLTWRITHLWDHQPNGDLLTMVLWSTRKVGWSSKYPPSTFRKRVTYPLFLDFWPFAWYLEGPTVIWDSYWEFGQLPWKRIVIQPSFRFIWGLCKELNQQ